jgi:ANTAR domain/GAF domain
MATSPPQGSTPDEDSGLVTALVTLAGLPDDAVHVDRLLVTIARLTADVVEPVSYASVSAVRDGAPTTVAASSQIAIDVDNAQYADGAGPCLDALFTEKPVSTDIGAVMAWPGFRDTAWQLGLRASLSIPVFAASGRSIAALNLYAHDPEPMTALIARVWAQYQDRSTVDSELPPLDSGGEELLAGIAAAFQVQEIIQQARGMIMSRDQVTAEAAYLALRAQAAHTGAPMPDTALGIISGTSYRQGWQSDNEP